MKRAHLLPLMLLGLFTLIPLACDSDDGVSAGNNEACDGNDRCENDCSYSQTSCNMSCTGEATCEATCQAGQSCSFTCGGNATCTFDCTQGQCQVSEETSANATCTGEYVGTCGGEVGGGEVGGGDCDCGAPLDPGYAACITACQG
ncbi:hypothetical protein KKB55_08775 [Myxococcota bacterium]|nr:hypothetical protein [Myxococcota bacterium]